MKPHICRACGKPIDEYSLTLNICLGCDREEEESTHMEIIKDLRAEEAMRYKDAGLPFHLKQALNTIPPEPEHKPCPFCGSTRIVKGERYFAMCVDCGATGPERISSNHSKTFKDWNTRV